ncbi:MAG: 50S ribosomal protein L40e [Nanoarchaeota archaeon]
MATFPEAEARLFKNVYVCKKCEKKFKTSISKVLAGKAVCRDCKYKKNRPVRMRSKK